MDKIRVAISGTGFMGREILNACYVAEDLEPAGVVEKFSSEDFVSLPNGDGLIPLSNDPAALIERARPDVIIDFSNSEWTPLVAQAALAAGVRMVIGTTGLPESFIKHLESECRGKGVGAVVAPNFAIGAVVMIHLAKVASRFFDYAEITEMHQQLKVDAPSGTAVATAQEMVAARGRPFENTQPEKLTLPGSRGATYEGVSIHSQRLPGFVAHQEVTFGGLGQTLHIRHNSTGRESFIPGIMIAVREVMQRNELVYGLDRLIGL
jgi:4-hydroxy-tetrahydrodipicolinate reductase